MNKRILMIVLGVFLIIVAGIGIAKGRKAFQGTASPSSTSAQEFYDQAQEAEQKGDPLKAKEFYQKLVSDNPDFKDVALAQQKLEAINMKIILSGIETPKTAIHEVVSGDSLVKIAKKYNTTVELIKKSNNLASNNIRVGERLRVWQGAFSVYVDKSQNILMLKSDGDVVKVYTVATGTNNITPVGTFTVTTKLVDPVWYKSGAIIPPESPKNILGTRWMGFNIPGYGIHGTTDPSTLGQQVTAGCIRMKNEDIEELYDLLPVGTQVTIVD